MLEKVIDPIIEPNKLPEPQDESVGGPLLNKGEVRKRKRGQLEVEDDDDDEEGKGIMAFLMDIT